jgi:hypothetical protein
MSFGYWSTGEPIRARLDTDTRNFRLVSLVIPALAAASGAADAAPTTSAAENVSAVCKDIAMTDPKLAGRVTIIRSGSGHKATVVRNDADGTILLEQHGKDHAALSVQSGTGERLVIRQSGAQASADVSQDGSCNATEIDQSGAGNRAVTTQSGSNNRVVIRQSAPQRGGEAE